MRVRHTVMLHAAMLHAAMLHAAMLRGHATREVVEVVAWYVACVLRVAHTLA